MRYLIADDASIEWRPDHIDIKTRSGKIRTDHGVLKVLRGFKEPRSEDELAALLPESARQSGRSVLKQLVAIGVLIPSRGEPRPWLPWARQFGNLAAFVVKDSHAICGAFWSDVYEAETWSDVLRAFVELATAVCARPTWNQNVHESLRAPDRMWEAKWHDLELTKHLFGFLADLPEGIAKDLNDEAGPRGARKATEQAEESVITSLADLTSDVYEHVFDYTSECDYEVKRQLWRLRPETVIDFAAGAGYYAFYLVSIGSHVTIEEINPCKVAFIAYRARELGVEEKISFRSAGKDFDCAIAMNALDHVADPAAVVRDLAAKLKEGGTLMYWALFPDDGWHTSDEATKAETFRALHTLFTVQECSSMNLFAYEILTKRAEPAKEPTDAEGYLMSPSMLSSVVAERVPKVHRGVSVDLCSEEGQSRVVHGSVFYLNSEYINASSFELLRRCDGATNVGTLASELSLTVEQCWNAVERLWEARYVGVRP